MNARGWVYVIVNKAMPNLVKIGFSTKDPITRARELDNTGAPHRYEVAYDALVDSPREVEQRVHGKLHASREGREWFRCNIELAVQTIKATVSVIHVERRSGKITNASPEVSDLFLNSQCWYSNCVEPVTRKYKDTYYCAKHYAIERRNRFQIARHEAGKA